METAMRHTRFASAGALVAVGGIILAGCSSANAPAEDITLTFWGTYGNGGNSAQTEVLENELIPAFEEANPGVSVNYVDMPYDGLKQKLTTSAAGGELPDLIRSDIGWVSQFAQLGVYRKLSGEMPDFKKLAADVYPGTLETTAWNGDYYGLPLNTNTRVLVTDKTALDAAGIEAPPATFDDLREMAEALEGTDVAAFADSGLSAWNVMPWIWSAGGDIADSDLTKASGYLDSPESVSGVQLLVDLYQAGQIPNLITGNTGATSTSDGLPTNAYASILDGPWMQDIWAGQYPDFEPIYAPVPAGDGGSISVVGGRASSSPKALLMPTRRTISSPSPSQSSTSSGWLRRARCRSSRPWQRSRPNSCPTSAHSQTSLKPHGPDSRSRRPVKWTPSSTPNSSPPSREPPRWKRLLPRLRRRSMSSSRRTRTSDSSHH